MVRTRLFSSRAANVRRPSSNIFLASSSTCPIIVSTSFSTSFWSPSNRCCLSPSSSSSSSASSSSSLRRLASRSSSSFRLRSAISSRRAWRVRNNCSDSRSKLDRNVVRVASRCCSRASSFASCSAVDRDAMVVWMVERVSCICDTRCGTVTILSYGGKLTAPSVYTQ